MSKVARDEKIKKKFIRPKRSRNPPRKRFIKELREKSEEEVLETLFSGLDIIIIESVARRTRGRKAE